ncbi:MAG TPA: Ig-like domain-containing protein [Gemmatimonadaceae bacterium]|nr:Ig-like domain-containing protein [Gemmatimonadaceae bacterium]
MRSPWVVLALGAAVILVGCDDDTVLSGPSTVGLSLTVSPRLDTIFAADTTAPGDTVRLLARVRSAATGGAVTGVAVSWTTSDAAVATVDANGLVSARGHGNATISADLAGKEQVKATIVVAQRTQSISVTPAPASIFVDDPIVVGDTVRLRAVARDRDGVVVTGTTITWRSSAPAIATVDGAGVVRAVALGTATITATGGGVSGNAAVQVRTLVKSVAVTSPVAQALVSDTVQLTAKATGQNDQSMGGRRFTWQSSNLAVATVDSTGRVLLVGAGTAQVTATSGFVSGSTSIQVLPRAIMSLDVGTDFSCGVANLGRGDCWGRDGGNRLGVPADSTCFDEVRSGVSGGCAISPLRFGIGVTLTSLSAGGTSACGMGSDAQVYCWGNDQQGQLGDGLGGGSFGGLRRATVNSVRFKSVTVGGAHACAISTTDTAYCWGADASGQLGDARRINSTTPIPLAVGFETFKWSRLSAGESHTCGVSTSGSAYCWGENSSGQLGNGAVAPIADTPQSVAGGVTFTEISAGGRHTCGIATGGDLYCWGANDSLQLGTSTAPNVVSNTPLLVPGISNVVQVSAGANHTCAIVQGGQAYCWGSASWGQVGNGATSGIVASPAQVSGAQQFRSISAGLRHSCGIDTSNTSWCWGSNVFGALGNELQAAVRATPQRVATPR